MNIRKMLALGLIGGGNIPIQYLLLDEFTDETAAGSLNNSLATDGKNVRVVTDAENKVSTTGGNLVFAGGKASPANGDPGLAYDARTRTAGLVYGTKYTTPATTKDFKFGFRITNTGNPLNGVINFTTSAIIKHNDNSSAGPTVGIYEANKNYVGIIALRAAGSHAFLQGGAFANFSLLGVQSLDANAELYPRIANFDSSSSFDWARIPRDLKYLPVPIASDGFGVTFGTTDGLGHAEQTGLGAGGSGLTWTTREGTWGVTSAKAQASAVDGTSGRAIATIDAGNQDVLITCTLTRSAGEVGIITRYYDADNWVAIIHDGTNLIWRTRLGGTEGDAPNAVAFAGGLLQVWIKGTNFNKIWNNVKIGPTHSGVNKPINDPILSNSFGIFTSDTGNTVDNFVVWPGGSFGEHAQLNTIFGVTLPEFVAFDGNSLTAGTTPVADTYPAQCLASLGSPGYCGINFGVYGQTADDMLSDLATHLSTHYNSNRKNIAVLWPGTIDLPNTTAAVVYAKTLQLVVLAKSCGFSVVVNTVLPSTTLDADAGMRTRRADYNTLVTNGASTNGYIAADVAANTTIGEDGDENNATYYVDGVHMTAAGYGIVAGIVKTSILSI